VSKKKPAVKNLKTPKPEEPQHQEPPIEVQPEPEALEPQPIPEALPEPVTSTTETKPVPLYLFHHLLLNISTRK